MLEDKFLWFFEKRADDKYVNNFPESYVQRGSKIFLFP